MPEVHQLAGMPEEDFKIEDGGTVVSFSLRTTAGERFHFTIPALALDWILANLEHGARLALAERVKARRLGAGPDPKVPPFITHADGFYVVDNDPSTPLLTMQIPRADRSPIHIPLGREAYERLRAALIAGPGSPEERKLTN